MQAPLLTTLRCTRVQFDAAVPGLEETFGYSSRERATHGTGGGALSAKPSRACARYTARLSVSGRATVNPANDKMIAPSRTPGPVNWRRRTQACGTAPPRHGPAGRPLAAGVAETGPHGQAPAGHATHGRRRHRSSAPTSTAGRSRALQDAKATRSKKKRRAELVSQSATVDFTFRNTDLPYQW